LFDEFLRLQFLSQVLAEKGREEGLAFFKGLGRKRDSPHFIQRKDLGEEESLDGPQRDRNEARDVRRAGITDDPPFPGTEKKFLPGGVLLATGTIIQLGPVAQVGEETYLENPLDFFFENSLVDQGEKSDQESEDGLVFNLFGGHFVDQFDKVAGPGKFANIFPEAGKRPDQVAVAEPDKTRTFFFEISHAHVRPDFQPVPETFSRTFGPLGDPFDLSEVERVEANDQVRLAVRSGMEDDGRGLVERHKKSYQKRNGKGRNREKQARGRGSRPEESRKRFLSLFLNPDS